jgi:surface-anchored protein
MLKYTPRPRFFSSPLSCTLALRWVMTSAVALSAVSTVEAQTPILTVEHVDLNMTYTPGATVATDVWSMEARDADNFVSYDPSNVLLFVGQDALSTRSGPLSGSGDFLGVPDGGTYFRLPASQNPNLLYLGVAAYGVDGSGASPIESYNVSTESLGRVSGTARWTRLSLHSVTGVGGSAAPGTFSVWQNTLGGPNVFMSSYDDGNPGNTPGFGFDTTDGISANDALWVGAGGHLHYNWGFSAPGRYEVSFRASAYKNDGNAATLGSLTQSQPITFVFDVEGVSAIVPEPSSAFLFLSAVAIFARQRRKRRPYGRQRRQGR